MVCIPICLAYSRIRKKLDLKESWQEQADRQSGILRSGKPHSEPREKHSRRQDEAPGPQRPRTDCDSWAGAANGLGARASGRERWAPRQQRQGRVRDKALSP